LGEEDGGRQKRKKKRSKQTVPAAGGRRRSRDIRRAKVLLCAAFVFVTKGFSCRGLQVQSVQHDIGTFASLFEKEAGC
jgi:hypothetical protein